MQVDNEKPLKQVNKATDIVGVDYIDFTIDFKNDRGKIYMGCPDDFFEKSDPIYKKKKATVVFTMREKDFFSLLRGQLGAMPAIRERKLFL